MQYLVSNKNYYTLDDHRMCDMDVLKLLGIVMDKLRIRNWVYS